MAFAKSEFRKVRKKYTDGLQIKHLKENNEEYEPESFSGCLALFLTKWLTFKRVTLR